MHLACEKMCLVLFQVVTFRKENATGIIFSSKHELTTRNLHAFAPDRPQGTSAEDLRGEGLELYLTSTRPHLGWLPTAL